MDPASCRPALTRFSDAGKLEVVEVLRHVIGKCYFFLYDDLLVVSVQNFVFPFVVFQKLIDGPCRVGPRTRVAREQKSSKIKIPPFCNRRQALIASVKTSSAKCDPST